MCRTTSFVMEQELCTPFVTGETSVLPLGQLCTKRAMVVPSLVITSSESLDKNGEENSEKHGCSHVCTAAIPTPVSSNLAIAKMMNGTTECFSFMENFNPENIGYDETDFYADIDGDEHPERTPEQEAAEIAVTEALSRIGDDIQSTYQVQGEHIFGHILTSLAAKIKQHHCDGTAV